MKSAKIPHSRAKAKKAVVKKGKKPPKSGVKKAAKTDFQKQLDKWPSGW